MLPVNLILIATNNGKSTLYILFAVAVLSFVALPLFPNLLHMNMDIWLLVLAIDIISIMFLGSIIIAKRSGPPW